MAFFSNQNSSPGPDLPYGPDLDMLIVGKTGLGKSATANSILGEDCFGSNSVEVLQKKIDGRKLLVVDTPGPSDEELLDPELCRRKAKQNLNVATCLSPDGFHAILIIFRYGQRMTKGEVEAIEEIKNLLGEDFMRDHGVLIITCGDDFENKMKGKKSFKTWCEEQDGYIQDVLQNCQNRCVLFNNRNDKIWKQQRFELVKTIDAMNSGKRYKKNIITMIEEKYRDAGDHRVGSGNKILELCRYLFLKLQESFFYWIPYASSVTSWSGFDAVRNLLPVSGVTSHGQMFSDEMKRIFEGLKSATSKLQGDVKQKLVENIKMAECILNKEYGLASNP